MRYIDVCSGISAPTAAWKPLGWQALCYAEIEAAPRAVLAHHYPDVPLVGDFTQIEGTEYGPVDLLVGGTPCQSFSIAGLRGGLADERGNLALEYLRLAHRSRARWLVWENVPGVLSIDGGRAFGAILGGMAELGYGFAYRVLDAQHFGVPQRRRRVFAVGYLGDWRRAAAVLFERQSLSGHPAPRRRSGQEVAGTLTSRATAGGGLGTDFETAGGLQAFGGNNTSGPIEVATSLLAHGTRLDFETETLITFDETQITSKANGSNPKPGDPCHTLAADARPPTIAFDSRQHPITSEHTFGTLDASSPQAQAIAFTERGREGGRQVETSIELHPALTAGAGGGNAGDRTIVTPRTRVRRLMPVECERLQGFEDGWTDVPYRGKPASDAARYAAIGNSWAVPCARWIGQRIEAVEEAAPC